MEMECLAEIVHCPVDADNIGQIIRHTQIPHHICRGMLLDSWGTLQPRKLKSEFGEESTGLDKVFKELGPAARTFRLGTRPEPLYRIMYLQYVFLLEKNINVYGFFYDFITRKKYGCRSETFQYNHVTNFAIRKIEFEEQDRWGTLGCVEGRAGDELEAFSLAVASGANFRCVLVNRAVVERMHERVHNNSKLAELESEAPETIDRLAIRGEIARRRNLQIGRKIGFARTALQHVRQQVEQYASLRD